MKTKQFLLYTLVIMTFLITACGGSASVTEEAMPHTDATEVMMEKGTPTADAMMEKETPTSESAMSKETPVTDAMMESPAWYSAPLTDVRTGQVFTINDFKGKVVLVETLAMWCPNCKKQQGQVQALNKLIGERDDFVSLGLDIDLNENAADLKGYVESNSFDWTYAVATTEIAQDISKNYGDQFLNPPSTPMLVIDRHGEAHLLPFGIKNAEELLNFIQPFLEESM